MITLNAVFWISIILFALIGAMRGWAKEILVLCSVIFALFIIWLLTNFFPLMEDTSADNATTRFFIQAGTIAIMVIFGYATPNLPVFTGDRFLKQRIQDGLLGSVFGAVNGYAIVGSLWYYMNEAGYFPDWITAPRPDTQIGQTAISMLQVMPPAWLVDEPLIFVAVALAFILIIWLFV